MNAVDITELDPGIRDVVSALWSAGLGTSDSGDGRSKPCDERVLNVEHVAIVPGSDGWETSRQALETVRDLRLGEDWQVELTRSMSTCDDGEVVSVLLVRLD